jgi:hypothetical protein
MGDFGAATSILGGASSAGQLYTKFSQEKVF